jgi:hypothetical protein
MYQTFFPYSRIKSAKLPTYVTILSIWGACAAATLGRYVAIGHTNDWCSHRLLQWRESTGHVSIMHFELSSPTTGVSMPTLPKILILNMTIVHLICPGNPIGFYPTSPSAVGVWSTGGEKGKVSMIGVDTLVSHIPRYVKEIMSSPTYIAPKLKLTWKTMTGMYALVVLPA